MSEKLSVKSLPSTFINALKASAYYEGKHWMYACPECLQPVAIEGKKGKSITRAQAEELGQHLVMHMTATHPEKLESWQIAVGLLEDPAAKEIEAIAQKVEDAVRKTETAPVAQDPEPVKSPALQTIPGPMSVDWEEARKALKHMQGMLAKLVDVSGFLEVSQDAAAAKSKHDAYETALDQDADAMYRLVEDARKGLKILADQLTWNRKELGVFWNKADDAEMYGRIEDLKTFVKMGEENPLYLRGLRVHDRIEGAKTLHLQEMHDAENKSLEELRKLLVAEMQKVEKQARDCFEDLWNGALRVRGSKGKEIILHDDLAIRVGSAMGEYSKICKADGHGMDPKRINEIVIRQAADRLFRYGFEPEIKCVVTGEVLTYNEAKDKLVKTSRDLEGVVALPFDEWAAKLAKVNRILYKVWKEVKTEGEKPTYYGLLMADVDLQKKCGITMQEKEDILPAYKWDSEPNDGAMRDAVNRAIGLKVSFTKAQGEDDMPAATSHGWESEPDAYEGREDEYEPGKNDRGGKSKGHRNQGRNERTGKAKQGKKVLHSLDELKPGADADFDAFLSNLWADK